MKKIKFSIFVSFIFCFIILFFFLLGNIIELIDIRTFAIVPRDWSRFHGIFTTVFFHSNFQHFLFNIIPLFVLIILLIYFYLSVFLQVLFFIWMVGGFGVFLWGANGFHIGASGLIFGLITFLISSGFIKENRSLLTVSMVVVFFYGGTLYGVLPLSPEVSWEGHLFGALSGILAAFIWRNKGPKKDMYLYNLKRKSQEDDEYSQFSS